MEDINIIKDKSNIDINTVNSEIELSKCMEIIPEIGAKINEIFEIAKENNINILIDNIDINEKCVIKTITLKDKLK